MSDPPSPFFLMIDEFQKFVTPDVPEMLDQAAKYGLHLFLFHQHLSQLKERDPQIYGALTNARTKIVFGGLNDEDVELISKELYTGELDPDQIMSVCVARSRCTDSNVAFIGGANASRDTS